MKVILNTMFTLFVIGLVSCGNDDVAEITVTAPAEYQFERSGANTVSFSGQTTRIMMAEELVSAMSDFDQSVESLNEMYANMDALGNDVAPFLQDVLNISTKSVRSKVAASEDLFNTNSVESLAIKSQFEDWMQAQINEVATNKDILANPGVAGQIADGTKTRFINANGLEYNQAVAKSLIGGLMLDQIVNNYLSITVLDDKDNRAENDNEITEEAQSYTTMEHKWDEAFGYFGVPTDLTVANFDTKLDAGEVRYHGKYAGVGQDAGLNTVGKVMNEFIKGRFGISNNDYTMRDQAASQLRAEWEMVIATTAIHYLNEAQSNFSDETLRNHELSEALAFIMSLNYNSDKLMSSTEINTILEYFKETPTGAPNAVFSLLNVTNQNINDAKDMISAAYGLNSVKDLL